MTRRYWLFKSEPDVFSIDDLERAPLQTTGWEGVRNYQARNLLRDEVKVGDEVFFYHSRQQPMHVAGVCRVVGAARPDPHQFDPASAYHDPDSSEDDPTWVLVDVQFVRKFPRLVTLAELRATPGLEDMMLLRKGARLSIQPVTPAEWKIITALASHPAPATSRPKPAPSRGTARKTATPRGKGRGR